MPLKAYAALKSNERKNAYALDLQMQLLMLNVEFNFEPEDIYNLEKINIGKTVYFDGINKDKFFDTIFVLRRVGGIIDLLASVHLGIRNTNNGNGKLIK
jgi:hypothetical protein